MSICSFIYGTLFFVVCIHLYMVSSPTVYSYHKLYPLHNAASSGPVEIVTLLLAHGAQESVNVKNEVIMHC